MKFYDVNCSIGGWPFRHVPRNSAELVRADLEALGAIGALAVNNGAILYSDTREANRELASQLDEHRDFFSAAMTIDPTAPRALDEIREFSADPLFKAVRLIPLFHRYAPDIPEAVAAARLAGELGLAVLLPSDTVNFRQRHFLAPETALKYADVISLIRQAQNTSFVWMDSTEGIHCTCEPNVYAECGRMNGTFSGGFAEFTSREKSRMIFGTGAPLRSPGANLIKYSLPDLTDEEREVVMLGNARKLGFIK